MPNKTIILSNEHYVSNSKNQFTFNFPSNYKLEKDTMVSLSQCQIPNSFFNVNNGNNIFSYIIPTSSSSYTATTVGLSQTITLTLVSGSINIGSILIGAGVPSNCYIVSQSSGTPNGTGDYILNVPINVSGLSITSSTIITDVILPSGCYSINDINNALIQSQISRGFYFYNSQSTITPVSGNTSINYGTYIYPITLSQTPVNYANTFSLNCIPSSSGNILSIYGTGFLWAGPSLPSINTFPQICFNYKSDWNTNNLANLLGFYCPLDSNIFPATQKTFTTVNLQNSQSFGVSSNSLIAPNSYAPNGSQVNSLIITCSLVSNDIIIKGMSNIIASFPINSKYGENINFSSQYEILHKCGSTSIQQITLNIFDQNMRPVVLNDTNCYFKLFLTT